MACLQTGRTRLSWVEDLRALSIRLERSDSISELGGPCAFLNLGANRPTSGSDPPLNILPHVAGHRIDTVDPKAYALGTHVSRGHGRGGSVAGDSTTLSKSEGDDGEFTTFWL
jgi:hypothetical protein